MDHETLTPDSSRLSTASKSPPRERLLMAARELFYNHGIRAVGVDAIAEAAGTNKMALYRHFESKDNLVAEYLRQEDSHSDELWDNINAMHPKNPLEQVKAWVEIMAYLSTQPNHRGCAFANAAVELSDPNHPGRVVITRHCHRVHDHLTDRLEAAGCHNPSDITDQLLLLVDGAHLSAQAVGPNGPSRHLRSLALNIIESHHP